MVVIAVIDANVVIQSGVILESLNSSYKDFTNNCSRSVIKINLSTLAMRQASAQRVDFARA